MNVARGTALTAAIALTAALVLTGCGSDAKDDSSDTSTAVNPAASWFQVRPVLTEQKAGAADCAATPTPAPHVSPIAAICSVDDSVVYSLGPAVLDDSNIDSVGSTDKTVQLGVTPSGKTTLETFTGSLAEQKEPKNQFAVVADGEVIDAPTVEAAVTDGLILFTFEDAAKLEPFMIRLSG